MRSARARRGLRSLDLDAASFDGVGPAQSTSGAADTIPASTRWPQAGTAIHGILTPPPDILERSCVALSDGVVGHVGGSVRGRAQYERDCHKGPAGLDRAGGSLYALVGVLGLQSRPPVVAQARLGHRSLLLVHHSFVRALPAHWPPGAGGGAP